MAPVTVQTLASDTSDGTEIAVTAVMSALLFAFLGAPAALVLRSQHARSVRRRQLLREWAAVDRRHESEFPAAYGTQGPHSRFHGASIVLVLAVLMALLVLADSSGTRPFAMLPGLVTVALFAGATTRKYVGRYRWASRENAIRGRARRRHRHRDLLTSVPEVRPGAAHPVLRYVALIAPVVIIAVIYAIARPRNALGLAVAALIALAVAVVGLPLTLIKRRRERTELDLVVAEAVEDAEGAFLGDPSGARAAVVHPIRYGLGELTAAEGPPCGADGVARWDFAPPRAGALVVGAEALHLRGADGSSLDLPLADLVGTAFIENAAAWLDPTVDLFLRSGEAIEVRSADAREIADSLSGAGVLILGG
ncbi:hypothetical protein [Streptomyces sp. NPDC002853]